MQQDDVGIVIIGRNEGARVRDCLRSLPRGVPAIYVDSGSTDGSLAVVKRFPVHVLVLDSGRPFTAARARNAGFQRLLDYEPQLKYVQFLDADSELDPNWIPVAKAHLEADPNRAIVFGQLREKSAEGSMFGRICELEWRIPPGEVEQCGGNTFVRASSFRQVGGFIEDMIAGEEPELCARMRHRGWSIHCLSDLMGAHDAAIAGFSQWWLRTVRSGHAFAEGSWRHKQESAAFWSHENRSVLAWGVLLPSTALALAVPTMGSSLMLFSFYSVLLHKTLRHALHRGFAAQEARLYAAFCVMAKIPQGLGWLRFHANRILRRPSPVIEYKLASVT